MRKLWNHKGFTLVELLIVVVILAILAAIVIPRLTTSRSEADEAMKTALQSAMTAQERYWHDNRTYANDVNQLNFEETPNVTVRVLLSGQFYIMCAKHSRSDRDWQVDSETRMIEIDPYSVC